MAKGRGRFACSILLSLAVFAAGDLAARSADGYKASDGPRRYIVLFEEQPLAAHLAQLRGHTASDSRTRLDLRTPARPDMRSPEARAYLQELDARFERFRGEARGRLGRELRAVHRYRVALNGFSASMTPREAKQLSKLPGVSHVQADWRVRMDSDSGPKWLGADELWDGNVGLPRARGEGVVVGIIDSGVNWDHASLRDLGATNPAAQYNHDNPYGKELGICDPPRL